MIDHLIRVFEMGKYAICYDIIEFFIFQVHNIHTAKIHDRCGILPACLFDHSGRQVDTCDVNRGIGQQILFQYARSASHIEYAKSFMQSGLFQYIIDLFRCMETKFVPAVGQSIEEIGYNSHGNCPSQTKQSLN